MAHIKVNIAALNEINFHNLTPEFYLNYYEGDYQDVDIADYKEIIGKLKKLNILLENPFSI